MVGRTFLCITVPITACPGLDEQVQSNVRTPVILRHDLNRSRKEHQCADSSLMSLSASRAS